MNFQANPSDNESFDSLPSDAVHDEFSSATSTQPAAKRKCAMCGKMFVPANLKFLPFCSQRCQQLDLRNWMTESYGLPVEGQEDREPFDELEPDQ